MFILLTLATAGTFILQIIWVFGIHLYFDFDDQHGVFKTKCILNDDDDESWLEKESMVKQMFTCVLLSLPI